MDGSRLRRRQKLRNVLRRLGAAARELTRRLPYPDPAKAEDSFRTALVIAREQGTRGYELRAATGLALGASRLSAPNARCAPDCSRWRHDDGAAGFDPERTLGLRGASRSSCRRTASCERSR